MKTKAQIKELASHARSILKYATTGKPIMYAYIQGVFGNASDSEP